MKWQVKDSNGTSYYETNGFRALLTSVKLVNKKAIADKIFNGQNKTVCAWIEFDDIIILPKDERRDVSYNDVLKYNPKVKPYWTDDSSQNLDGKQFNIVQVVNRNLYTKNKKN